MQAMVEQIEVVVKAQWPVLIYFESGTGKELVAHALHQQSDPADGAFSVVNGAGIPAELQNLTERAVAFCDSNQLEAAGTSTASYRFRSDAGSCQR